MRSARAARAQGAFTLIEMMMGASIMAVVSAALIGAVIGQSSLNATARNLTAAMTDATRVMEEIRAQNTGAACTAGVPSAKAPNNRATWDEWLYTDGGGKTVPTGVPDRHERLAVTCTEEGDQNRDGIENNALCGALPNGSVRAQVASGEWSRQPLASTSYDPIRVTVAVGWVQNGRIMGRKNAATGAEFTYQPERKVTNAKMQVTMVPAQLEWGPDANQNGMIESQAMLATAITCR
ncbi:MAG: type II secretion system protein [Candidatus Omnitrophica bacterium]|nr:type II secretion system protein [Candidatus Omnitrophota bacterium]